MRLCAMHQARRSPSARAEGLVTISTKPASATIVAIRRACMAVPSFWRMIFSENRYPLFGTPGRSRPSSTGYALGVEPPRREAGADQRLRTWEIVDQLEALAAGGGVGDHPVADFVRAIAGARQRVGEKGGEAAVLAMPERLDAGVVEFLVDPAHGRLADRMAQAAGAEHRHPQRLGIALDRLPQQPAPGQAALDARHRLLEIVDDHRHQRQADVDADAPERNAGAVIELEAMRECRLEILRQRGLEQVAPERGVALEPGMRIDLLHERLGRAIVFVADADADGGQVVDEEVDPVIGRDDHQQIGPAGREPTPDLVEGSFELVAMRARHRLPIARDDRPVARRENPDQASHGRAPPLCAAPKAAGP